MSELVTRRIVYDNQFSTTEPSIFEGMKMSSITNKIAIYAILSVGVLCTVTSVSVGAEKSIFQPDQKRLTWWQNARFGMFIHWGPVSLKGTEIGWSRGRQVPVEEYDSLYKQFNPTKFNADEWVSIAKNAGMKYLVITSKHHDGFCLFDSQYTDYDIMSTPFKRDVLRELSDACRRQGIAFGTYYSILDWYNPDYPLGSPGGRTKKPHPNMARYEKYVHNQTRELAEKYGPLLTLWFDGQWESPWTPEYGMRLFKHCRALDARILVNNRVSKSWQGKFATNEKITAKPGDYDTPEQRIGAFNNQRPWETCMTLCRQWAWKPNDKMKSLKQCLQTLIRTAGGDGNLLFNVGPMPDGRIEPRQVKRLREMGAWLKQYGESIYGTRGGPFKPGPWGASTYKNNLIYLHVLAWTGDTLTLPPIPKKIIDTKVLTGGKVKLVQSDTEITVYVAKNQQKDIDTLILLTLDSPAKAIAPVGLPSISLAYKKKSSASNVFQKLKQFRAASAFDDDDSTRWATDSGTSQAWLAVDLGSPKTVCQAVIKEAYAGRVKKFELQYGNHGHWKTFYQGKALGENAKLVFPPVTARKFRLNILEATDGPTIWEFQLIPPKSK